jgi:hypothetical protein
VFILKVAKALCFDTLLQVLILKIVRGGHRSCQEERTKAKTKDNAETQRSHPECSAKRGCKLLKTNSGTRRERRKGPQEIDRSRVRAGATGGARGLPARELRDLGRDGGDHREG